MHPSNDSQNMDLLVEAATAARAAHAAEEGASEGADQPSIAPADHVPAEHLEVSAELVPTMTEQVTIVQDDPWVYGYSALYDDYRRAIPMWVYEEWMDQSYVDRAEHPTLAAYHRWILENKARRSSDGSSGGYRGRHQVRCPYSSCDDLFCWH